MSLSLFIDKMIKDSFADREDIKPVSTESHSDWVDLYNKIEGLGMDSVVPVSSKLITEKEIEDIKVNSILISPEGVNFLITELSLDKGPEVLNLKTLEKVSLGPKITVKKLLKHGWKKYEVEVVKESNDKDFIGKMLS